MLCIIIVDPVYNPNEKFSFESLSLLQSAAGIPLLSELEKRRRDFLRLIRVKQTATLEDALKQWITVGVPSHIEPTWKSIRLLLCLLNLDKLECQVGRVLKNDNQLSDNGANAPCEYQYCSRIFLIYQKTTTYEIHFIITRNIKDHVSVSKHACMHVTIILIVVYTMSYVYVIVIQVLYNNGSQFIGN